jgi:hypothetical protein
VKLGNHRWSLDLRILILPLVATTLAGAIFFSPKADPVAEFKSTQKGLMFEPGTGYLRSLLKELKIDPSSQMLVWSKSSLQTEKINRKNPRAIYFNEDTYVGWIPGASLIEIMSIHPTKGAIFYKVLNTKGGGTKIEEEDLQCSRCHGSRNRGLVPELFTESSHVAESSYPRPLTPSRRVRMSTPIKHRWGGWYVTGTHGKERHMGNAISGGTDEAPLINREAFANLTSLSKLINTKKYLTPHSDIVALMVSEKQMFIQNTLSQASLDLQTFDEPDDEACEPLVRALLCSYEAKITSPMKGTSQFASVYAASAPKDSKGRSFSQLDMNTRILKYSCSPLIYSKSFDAIPERGRKIIWQRFEEILSGKDDSEPFKHLTADLRKAIREILSETKPEFAAFLKQNSS